MNDYYDDEHYAAYFTLVLEDLECLNAGDEIWVMLYGHDGPYLFPVGNNHCLTCQGSLIFNHLGAEVDFAVSTPYYGGFTIIALSITIFYEG
jgi:hypothetical protein